MLDIYDAYSREKLRSLNCTKLHQVKNILTRAKQGQKQAKSMPRHKKVEILIAASQKILEQKDTLAKLICEESGKPITQAYKEVARCHNTIVVSAAEVNRNVGELIPFDSVPGNENKRGYFSYEPLGIVFAITPYNDPLNLVAHKVGPAIASGNSLILKPSEKAPSSAIALLECFYESGLPRENIQLILGGPEIVQAILPSRDIRMLSFTGGVETAEKLCRQAGLKKLLMDLGGNAPVIVDNNSDLDLAIESVASGSFYAAGQNCIGVQRVYLHREIFSEFSLKLVTKVAEMRVGNPHHIDTDMGPMIDEIQACKIEGEVSKAISCGANLLIGNIRKGALYYPTVLSNVPIDSPLVTEEVFAPLVVLHQVDSIDEAILLANNSDSMLHASVFTKDIGIANYAAERLDAGGVMINDSSDFRLDAMPFGGFKYGSLGREGVRFAIAEMSQTKVVCTTFS